MLFIVVGPSGTQYAQYLSRDAAQALCDELNAEVGEEHFEVMAEEEAA